MILQKLTIHNIASIEHATIDFEAQPLADSEVFLITGKTGAGKSTILDAICLALYANTPRLDNTNMQGKTKDQDKEIKLKDPVLLMRRNTAEAYTALLFTGSNGVHYEAIWSVARAHNKVTGKIQGKKWSLHNLDTDHAYTKDKEIQEEISRAIGLDFKQFCRTTLLAQGEFTRFLNSKDDDKAEILEKITGVDAYSKIGVKIFEKTSVMKKLWEDAQLKTAGITLLSEEEKANKNAELETLAEQDKQLRTSIEAINKKLTWLKEEQELRLRHTQAKEAFEQAQALLASDEKKEEERLINQWNKTIDARHWLHETEAQTAHIEELSQNLFNQKNNYLLLQDAYLFELEAAQKIALQKKQIDDYIEAEQPKVSLYENAQSISELMSLIEEGRKKWATYQDEIKKQKSQLQDFLPLLTQAKEKLDEHEKSLLSQEQNLQQEYEALESLNLPTLRRQSNELSTLSNLITTALSILEQYKEEKKRIDQAQANLSDLSEDIKQKKEQTAQATLQVHDAEIEKNTAKAIFEKQRESINKWAKSIRLQLHIGDVCPVCQQKVSTALPHEENIDALVAETAKAAKEAEEKYDKLMAAKNTLDANILALTRQYKNDALAFENGKKVLANTGQRLKGAFNDCQLEKILASEEILLNNTGEAQATLMLAQEKIANKNEAVGKKVSDAEIKEKQVKALQKAVDQLRKQVEKLRDITSQAEKRKDDCEHQVNNLLSLSNSKETEVNDAIQKATNLTGTTKWTTSPLAYAQQITQAAASYNKQKEEKQKVEKVLTQYQYNNGTIANTLHNILQYMPNWHDCSLEEVQHADGLQFKKQHIDNLPEKATQLQTEIASMLNQLKTSQEALDRNQKSLNDFITQQHLESSSEQHMELSLLKELNTYSQVTIAEKTKSLNEAKQALSQKEAILKEAENAYKDHLQNAHDLEIEGNIEKENIEGKNIAETNDSQKEEYALSLSSRLQAFETEQQELNNKRGGILRDLEIDQINHEKIGHLKEEEEKKKAEYHKWDRLNQLLGDATGNKFRRIAQSYILASLIHSANSYMRTLTDRYVLKVVPGTFIIMMEDAYQGYVSRAASTLSGGESFLVSLSLALALSDIGTQLSVDTLFIDEGFGTLSGEPLQHAINTLRGLHTKSGRHVGIISHVEELKERIPVQIRVNQEGNNSNSTIEIVG